MRYILLLLLTTTAGAAVLSNGQISCTITENGIQSISFLGRVVTTPPSPGFPTHQGFYESLEFPPDEGTIMPGPVVRSILTSTPVAVILTDLHSNMTVQYTYSLAGSDINMQAVLKNNDTLPFSNIMIALPTFAFGSGVVGNMKTYNADYMIKNPQHVFHPGTWSPLAASYAHDENYGLALDCKSHFDKPSLFNAFRPGVTMIRPPTVADMTLYIHDSVQPGDRLVVEVTMHFTKKTDLPSLLSSYIRDFRKFAGPMEYLPDDRPWLQFAAGDSAHLTAQNPLGYNGDVRRLDLPSGIRSFEDMVWPCNEVTQGTLFWQPQGYNPRGCEYRPDFDVWPDSVSANLPALIAWYRSNGLKFGLCTRPGEIVTPSGPNTDQTCQLDANNASQMAMLIARFDAVKKRGVNAFYLDSFGTDLNSYRIMKQLRAHLGNAVPTYSEFTSDLMLPYSGMYTQLDLASAAKNGPPGKLEWYDADTLTAFRLLYPHSTILVDKIDGESSRPLLTPNQLAALKLTPIVSDFLASQYRVYFEDLIANHMNGNVWK